MHEYCRNLHNESIYILVFIIEIDTIIIRMYILYKEDYMKKIYFILCLLVPTNILSTHVVSVPRLIEKSVKISDSELKCLADNIFYEANSESYEGKLAVATVTLNRVKSKGFPNTVCGVVKQRSKKGCQFSWVCGQRALMNKKIYASSRKVAVDALLHKKRLTSIQNALYFHGEGVSPSWMHELKPIKKIGPHIFYVIRRNS